MLNQLFFKLCVVPTKQQLARLLEEIKDDCVKSYELTSNSLKKRMNDVAVAVTTFPKEMGDKVRKKVVGLMDSVAKTLRKRDEVYLKKIDEHAACVKTLQEVNKDSIILVSDRVFKLQDKFRDLETKVENSSSRKDIVLAHAHQQQIDSDKKFQEVKNEVSFATE